MSQIFQDPANQSSYERDGFVVVDFLSPVEGQEVLSVYESMNPDQKKGFHSSIGHVSPDYRKKVYDTVIQYADGLVKKLFIDYIPFTASFVVKEPDASSAVPLHQDWNVTEEKLYPSFNVWVSLNDATTKNGALYLLPGSHKLSPTFRGSGLPNTLENCKDIKLEQLKYVPTKAGQAIIYDVRTFHASPPNLSNQKRVSCAIGVAPREAKLLHYGYNRGTGKITEYSISPDFFWIFRKDPNFLKEQNLITKDLESSPKQFSMSELSHLVRKDTLWNRLMRLIGR